MTNKEKLVRDLQLIATNHGLVADVQGFVEDAHTPCIRGGRCNVPTLSDLQMLCMSVGLSEDCVDITSDGARIITPAEWRRDVMNQEWTPAYEFWLRADQTTVSFE